MASPVTPPRGMRDFLPADKARRERVLGVIRGVYSAHGFDEIETPVMEDSDRLHAGLGGDNEKIAFAVLKRGLTSEDLAAASDPLDLADLGLRFDLTVPLTRFYASHRSELPGVFRSIQIAPVWRAERPQKGRYRQFMQCDIDVIGEAGALAEVELLTATIATLEALGLNGCSIRINDRRILTGMLAVLGFAASDHDAVVITIDKLDKIGHAGVVAELRERGFGADAVDALHGFLASGDSDATGAGAGGDDAGAGAGGDDAGAGAGGDDADADAGAGAGDETAGAETADTRADAMAAAGIAPVPMPFDEVAITRSLPSGVDPALITALAELGRAVIDASPNAELVFDPFLVRGMGYYTGTIFEIAHPGFSSSLGGGGRYDGMIGRFLGADVPAAGFSIGFERIVDLVELAADTRADALALIYDDGVSPAALVSLKTQLIGQGKRVRLERRPRNMKPLLAQLAASGFTRFATVTASTVTKPATGVDQLEFRELA